MLSTTLGPKPVFRPDGVLLPVQWTFHLADTLDCGQAFRWRELPDKRWFGVAGKKYCYISQLDSHIFLEDVSKEDFEDFWRVYFDCDRDYEALRLRFSQDPTLKRAVDHAPGLRVLRQEPWEALCSFIISQNNNVKRIQGIVQRLCESFGEPLSPGIYAFPGPEVLAPLTPEDLAPLRAGFRARYLIDAARKVSEGAVRLDLLDSLPLEEARQELMKIIGVGIKVADCALLYGCGRVECVPVDVWIRRVLEKLFPQGLPPCAVGSEGLAQQFLFHYARTCSEAFDIRE